MPTLLLLVRLLLLLLPALVLVLVSPELSGATAAIRGGGPRVHLSLGTHLCLSCRPSYAFTCVRLLRLLRHRWLRQLLLLLRRLLLLLLL